MARFRGVVGFVQSEETSPGVASEFATEYTYRGDVLRDTRRLESDGVNLNDNLNISNRLSIVGDAYAYGNFQFMRYVEWKGSYWKISNVEIVDRRLILTIGGLYNGPTL
jgi:hypothetical protein